MSRFARMIASVCLLGFAAMAFGETNALPDKLTVEWIHSKEARQLSATPALHFAGANLMMYDRRLPEAERTIEIIDPKSGDVLVRVDRDKALASLDELMPDAKSSGGQGDGENSDDEEDRELEWPGVVSADGMHGIYIKSGDIFLLDVAASTFTRLTESDDKEKSARFSPDGKTIGFIRDNDLYVLDVASGKEKRLTRDGSETTLNGTLSWVYWEELFGRSDRGYEFSPDSKRIAFLQFDDSPVDVMTFVDPRPNGTKVIRQRYPKAGTTNPRVRAGIIDLASKKTTWIDLGTNPYEYIARLVWRPDGSSLVVQTMDRAQQNLDVFLADAATGKVRHLFRDTDDAWIDVHDDMVFLDGGQRFLWVSSRKGQGHIFLYEITETGARVVRQLTSGDWSVIESASRPNGTRGAIAAVDEDKKLVYFMSGRKSHLEGHLERVGLDGKGLAQVTTDEGSHSTSWGTRSDIFIDNHSSFTRPSALDLRTSDGKLVRRVNETSDEVATHFGFSPTELITVKADDGFELSATIQRPMDFDASKRYPVIVNVYGGPASPRVRNRWAGSLSDQLLCQEGYLLFTIDPRTSTLMGKPTTRLLLRNFYGEKEAADIVAGVRWLKTQPYVDPERVGVTGWSGGGSTTLSVMTRSEEFRAGIAGAGVYDYRLYDTIYTERFMKLPEDNVEGYKGAEWVSRVDKLHGRVLLIHGTYDDNVHPQNTWRLVDALEKAGVVFDLAMYPMQKHGFRGEEVRLHLDKTRIEFWKRELGGE